MNPRRINPVDIYGLISEFEAISLVKAKDAVAKWFGVQLGDLRGKGLRETRRPQRKVPKKPIVDLLARYRNMRIQQVEPFISELRILIPDYSARKQRNVCSSPQPFDMVKKIK
jgi:hypothetical protein